MLSIPLILAAGSLPTLISGFPHPSILSGIVESVRHSHFLERRESATSYAVFGGSGTTSDGWPAISDWVSDFDTMFEANQGVMSSSCTQFGASNNSPSENADISNSIKSVASSTGIDPRFILAIVMQESNGCVRAPTTNYGVVNPGLMQSHDGAGTCNDGTVSNPCPSSQITQMIQDGTAGTSSGDGLKQCLAASGATDVSMYYKAARIYNSGSMDSSGNLGAGIATHCYASDVANRLIGWASGPSSCESATIVSLTTSESFVSGSSGSSGSSDSSSESTSAATPEAAPSLPSKSAPTESSIPGGAFAQTAASVAPEATTTAASTPTSDPAPIRTVIVNPLAASTTPIFESTIAAAPNSASTIAASAPAASSSTGTGSAITVGTACTTEGEWNCVNGTSFQQCGSGTWSVVQQLAAGTSCTAGESTTIDIVAGTRKRAFRFSSEHIHRHIHRSS